MTDVAVSTYGIVLINCTFNQMFHSKMGKWKMENGKWKMENGKWKMGNGKWEMGNGKWKMEKGKMKNEKWKMENGNNNFVTGARIAVLLCTETTQKIYRGGAEVEFFSRSRFYNKNYGTSDEGYFFSGTVDNYEFYPQDITIPESFIEFRGFLRDWQSVDCVILFFLTARLYRIYIMSNLMKTAEEFLSVRFGESDYGVLAVGFLHHPLFALEKKNASSFIDIFFNYLRCQKNFK